MKNKISRAIKREVQFMRGGHDYRFIVYHALRSESVDNFFLLVNAWLLVDSPRDGPALVQYLRSIGEQAWTRTAYMKERAKYKKAKSQKLIGQKLLARYESVSP